MFTKEDLKKAWLNMIENIGYFKKNSDNQSQDWLIYFLEDHDLKKITIHYAWKRYVIEVYDVDDNDEKTLKTEMCWEIAETEEIPDDLADFMCDTLMNVKWHKEPPVDWNFDSPWVSGDKNGAKEQ